MWLLSSFFEDAISGPWITDGLDVQYRKLICEEPSMICITFQGTASNQDVALDLDFFVTPYRDMKTKWLAHRGFVIGYKSVRDKLLNLVKDYKKVLIRGYSLGAAYATLFHEDVKFHYPEKDVHSLIFGSPRVFLFLNKELKKRCKGILNIFLKNDIVSILPPWSVQVGTKLALGDSWFPTVKGHLIESYREKLREL